LQLAWAQASTAAAPHAARNIYAAGGQVRPAGPVEGDFVAAGGRVIVDQPVKGDVAVGGGSVDVRAPVGDDVRAAGGDVSIDSTVGGELFATGGSVTLAKAARVAQGAKLYGGNVTIDGKVDGGLDVGAQKITLNGEVDGDARLAAEQIELGPNARITGALRYTSPSELKKAEGATIGGTVTREERAVERRRERADRHWQGSMRVPFWGRLVFTFLALLACAAVFLLVLPGFAIRTSDTVKASPGLALALGFGTLVAVPVLAVLLFITLLGIPLGLTVLALYPVLLLAGYVVGVLFIARLAQTAMRKDAPASFALRMGFFALALLLVMLISRLPFVGGLALGAITVVGSGACVLELYRGRRAGAASERPGQGLQA
jgi:cytoskeletal protein CcmA (bactofilin family)